MPDPAGHPLAVLLASPLDTDLQPSVSLNGQSQFRLALPDVNADIAHPFLLLGPACRLPDGYRAGNTGVDSAGSRYRGQQSSLIAGLFYCLLWVILSLSLENLMLFQESLERRAYGRR